MKGDASFYRKALNEGMHGNGAGWWRILPSPTPSTYPTLIYLSVTLPVLNCDDKSVFISVFDRFGYPRPIPIPQCIIFLTKKEVFFNLGCNVVIHYPTKRWWWSMTLVMEERDWGCEMWKEGERERNQRSECRLTDWDSNYISEMI